MITVKNMISQKGRTADYCLFSLKCEKCLRFAIYVCNGEDSAMEMLECSEEQARELFNNIVSGEISVEHLSDIVDDHRHAAFLF